MQASARHQAHSSAPPLPVIHAANGKLASGPQTTTTEPKVWEPQTLTHESWWGNDSMHARYYNPNLGRFLSVDPVGGEVGSSQSWNRYAYVDNNPVSFVDALGLDKILGIHSNAPADAELTAGHAWLSYQDTDTGERQTFGLWPDGHAATKDNGPGWDIRFGMEDAAVPVASRHFELTDEQASLLAELVSQNVTWTKTNTCASWASDTAAAVTGETVDADDAGLLFGFVPIIGAETPREITKSIQQMEAAPTTEERAQDREPSTSAASSGAEND